MPLYEYACAKCGHHFEKIESTSASARKKCPKCGGKSERVLTAPAIQFKGSGWYVTDYAGKSSSGDSKKAEAPAGDSSKTTTAKESSSSKDSKPAKKDKS